VIDLRDIIGCASLAEFLASGSSLSQPLESNIKHMSDSRFLSRRWLLWIETGGQIRTLVPLRMILAQRSLNCRQSRRAIPECFAGVLL
jgi:hypothetical protein